jgi:hypothetical protein
MARDKKNVSPFMIWLEEAWEGWIRPLGAILLLAIAYLLYRFDLVGERTAGVIAVLAVVLGAIGSGVLPAWPLTRAPWQRAMLATAALTALVATLYPTLRMALPGAMLADGTLTAEQATATLTTGQSGPYELTVSGHFKDAGRSDAEASYTIKGTDNSGNSDEVSGAINRKMVTIRSRKGSSSSLHERNESTHAMPHLRGPQVTLTADANFDQLDGGLKVELRHGGLPAVVFIVLGALALVMALVLDTRLVELKSKKKSYLTTCIAIAFLFALHYPDEATPHSLVRPAVSSFLLALIVGGLAGWLAGGIARALFGPKVKKAAPAPRR